MYSLGNHIPLSLYVHFPWCLSKCPYCDFNSHALRGELAAAPYADYVDALLRDLERDTQYRDGRAIQTIFLGGGTPSLFPSEAIHRLLEGVRARVPLAGNCEITLEANPGASDRERFAGYRAAGVNRLSIGVQSFDDRRLKSIGRVHTGLEAHRAFDAAVAAGFDNINLDLMWGLPGQTVSGALSDVREAISLAPTHLSAYQLTIERHTAFHAEPPLLPDEDVVARMHEAVPEAIEAGGFQRYEVSAYARPGRECRHNLNYWTFGDYLGIGAGAHGKLTTRLGVRRTAKQRHPDAWITTAGGTNANELQDPLTSRELLAEFSMNALRLTHGFPAELFTKRTGLMLSTLAEPLRVAATRGLVTVGPRIAPTPLGQRYLDTLLELLV